MTELDLSKAEAEAALLKHDGDLTKTLFDLTGPPPSLSPLAGSDRSSQHSIAAA